MKSVDFNASRINLFIGKPNSGKSNLLEALALPQLDSDPSDNLGSSRFLRAEHGTNLFYDDNTQQPIEIDCGRFISFITYSEQVTFFLFVSAKRGGLLEKQKHEIRKKFHSNFHHSLLSWKNSNTEFSFSALANHGHYNNDKFDYNLGARNFSFPIFKYDFPAKFSAGYSHQGLSRLHPSGQNLYEVVKINGILKTWLARVFSEYDLELLLDNRTRQFEIQKKQDGYAYKIPFSSTPDTVRRMLYHMAAIHSNNDAVILFEEPEAHSFPPYIDELAATIAEDADNQYFITTHSPYLLNRFLSNVTKKGELGVFYTYWKNYQTNIRKLTEKEITSIFESGSDIFLNMDVLEND
ncbi:MAG: ATP-binding protein [Flavobacteriales bacterium]|nr:ATP-binding protein [Flavobacteriales bacterium]